MAVAYEQRRFSVDDYYAMGAAGVFGPDERVELVDGEIVAMPPITPRHGGMVMRITETLMTRFGNRTIVDVQGPARISRFSEPQPDLALLRPRSDYYSNAHPAPADIFAIIEVAESSLRYDLGKKRAVYARAEIEEYWIVDVVRSTITILREPREGDYRSERTVGADETVAFLAFPDDPILVSSLLVVA